MMPSSIQELTAEEIFTRLSTIDHREHSPRLTFPRFPPQFFNEIPQNAAVLVPFQRISGQWNILFTRRKSSLPEHSGQVAFPGGRADPGDGSAEETALREAKEEINLSSDDVEVLGRLHELQTISNYCVQPVVGVIPWPYEFKMAKEEVSRVFTIPLEWLADPNHHEIKLRELPGLHSPVPVIYFDHYEGELLWGVSAEITLDLMESLQII